MPKVTISFSHSVVKPIPADFVPKEPQPRPTLVWQSSAFPWDLPYVWEEQKDLGWPAEIVEADDPLTVFLDMATRHGRVFYDPLALVPEDDREYWHAVLNSVLRSPDNFVWPDDYVDVGNFAFSMGANPAETSWWERRVFATLLEDARTLQGLSRRYGVDFVGMPAEMPVKSEPRRKGRRSKLGYDWAYRVTQSGLKTDREALDYMLLMQGFDQRTMTRESMAVHEKRYRSAMKHRGRLVTFQERDFPV